MEIGFMLFGLLLAAAGLLMIAAARGQSAQLTGMPRISCGDAAGRDGPARVEARLQSDSPLVSPMSGLPCVYFRLELQRYKSARYENDSSTSRWETESSRVEWAECRLVDPSGALAIDPGLSASVAVASSRVAEPRSGELLALLRDMGGEPGILERCRLRETSLPEGALVFATGLLETRDDGTAVLGGKDLHVSSGSERDVRRTGLAIAAGGALVLVLGVVLLVAGMRAWTAVAEQAGISAADSAPGPARNPVRVEERARLKQQESRQPSDLPPDAPAALRYRPPAGR